jgi:hypothetical protein
MSDPQGRFPTDPNRPAPWGQPQQDPVSGPGYGNSGYPQHGGSYPPEPYPAPQPEYQQPDYQQPGYQQPGYPQPGYPQPGYQQPGSQQPGYQQPGYEQPGYQQPGYQQPGYPQPGYQQPVSGSPYAPGQPYPPDAGWYGGGANPVPPPPPRRSRGLLIGGLVVLAVLLCGGAATAVVLVANNNTTKPGAAASSSASKKPGAGTPTAAATTPGRAAGSVTLTAPDRIGSLKKSADQSLVTPMKTQMENAGLSDPFTVVYDDTAAAGRKVIVWGGTGPLFGVVSADKQLDSFFSSAGANTGGGSLGARSNVDPGSVGGKAQCAKVNGLGATMSMCAWSGNAALLGFIFTGVSPDKSGPVVHTMLPAIVVKQ